MIKTVGYLSYSARILLKEYSLYSVSYTHLDVYKRQDPGESRFYLSLEDDLLRLFGSDRLMAMFEAMGCLLYTSRCV